MTKATESQLGDLHGAIAEGLTEIIREGTVVSIAEDGSPVRGSAGAAFFMAGITFLKNNNITADAGKNAELAALSEALNKRRRASKEGMGKRAYDEAAAQLERDLGGLLQ